MAKKTLLFFVFLTAFFFQTKNARAFDSIEVIINEIAWMGQESSFNDEWLELYNNSSSEIDLSGWEIKSENGKLNIKLNGKISAKGFFVLERTDDQTLPEIPADLIYKGSLNNSGEHLVLLDKEKKLIDEINCQNGWFAGDNKTKQTMERKNSLLPGNDKNNWQNSAKPGGSPKKENKAPDKETLINPENQKTETPGLDFLNDSNDFLKIYISEILPSPEGPDTEKEWIEIFNEEERDIDLSRWQIKDVFGKTRSYFFPEKTFIKAGGFLVLYSSLTKITLNNDKDSVLLINPAGKTVDSVSFIEAPKGKSYCKINGEWFWTSSVSPGKNNFISEKEQPLQTENFSEQEKKIKNLALKNTASFNNQKTSNFNFSFLLMTALLLSFSSGIIFLFIKNKIKLG